MKTLHKLALGTAAIIGLSAGSAQATDYYDNGKLFTSHHIVDEMSYEEYAEGLSAEEKLELRRYLDYVKREPCQNYRPAPAGFVKDGCDLERIAPAPVKMVKVVHTQVREPDPKPMKQMKISPVLTDYVVNFDFDSAKLETQAKDTLDKVAKEIRKYNPREVTVVGHADKAGPASYNVNLSERRAQAVSDALHDRGVKNRILDKEAYGETQPAVPTKDGVALRENRRVVVEFRK